MRRFWRFFGIFRWRDWVISISPTFDGCCVDTVFFGLFNCFFVIRTWTWRVQFVCSSTQWLIEHDFFNFEPLNTIFVLTSGLLLITSTLTAIIFLHYRVATKMALEILGYTMCRVRLWIIVYDGWWAYHLKYLNWYMSDWRGMELFFWVFRGKGASYKL